MTVVSTADDKNGGAHEPETLYSTPNAARKIIIEVLPAEISGRGRPVGGMLPVTTRALIVTCTAYTDVIPKARR